MRFLYVLLLLDSYVIYKVLTLEICQQRYRDDWWVIGWGGGVTTLSISPGWAGWEDNILWILNISRHEMHFFCPTVRSTDQFADEAKKNLITPFGLHIKTLHLFRTKLQLKTEDSSDLAIYRSQANSGQKLDFSLCQCVRFIFSEVLRII